MTKYVDLFTEGNADMRNLLGGKGANLAEMTNLGLPVPQGFTITTEACTKYYEDGKEISPEIQDQINEYIGKMEEITGKKFGDKENPLLVSVRSGARASMPGMMDTILNLGLNEDVVEVLAEKSNNPRWAWDCYRRFIQMYSDVVMEVGKKYFEELIDKKKAKKGVKQDVEEAKSIILKAVQKFKKFICSHTAYYYAYFALQGDEKFDISKAYELLSFDYPFVRFDISRIVYLTKLEEKLRIRSKKLNNLLADGKDVYDKKEWKYYRKAITEDCPKPYWRNI